MPFVVGRRIGYLLGIVTGLLLLAGVAVLVVARTDWGHEQARTRIVGILNGAIKGQVKMGRMRGNLLTGATIEDFEIADSNGVTFLKVPRMSARYSIRGLASKRLFFDDVVLERPLFVLDQPPGGEWNVSRLFASDTTKPKETGPGWGSWFQLRRVRINDGHILVRSAWKPSDTLSTRARDSVIADALSREGNSRMHVVRVPGGFQSISEFRDVNGHFPLIRLTDPEEGWMRIETEKIRMTAIPFDPPRADIRELTGVFEFTGDSAWFSNVRVALPSTKLALGGRYYTESGRLLLDAKARDGALADLRWVYPTLPDSGRASADFSMRWEKDVDTYAFRKTDVRIGDATMSGDIVLGLSDTVALDVRGLRFARFPTRLVTQLVPALEFPRPGRLTGSLEARGGLGDLFLDGDIAYAEPRSGTSRVIARGRIGVTEDFRADALELRFLPARVALARLAMPSLPVGGTITGRARLDGRVDRTLRARMDLVHVDRGERSRIAGTVALTDAGKRGVNADVRLAPLSLVTVGRFAPAAGLRGVVAGPVRATGRTGDLHVVSDLAVAGGGGLFTDIRVDLENPVIAWAGSGRLTVFNASAIAQRAPATAVTGSFSTRGRGTDPATMTAMLQAQMATSQYDSVAVDSAKLRLAVADGVLRVDSTDVWGPHAHAFANGTLGLVAERTGRLDFALGVDSLQAFARYLPPADTGVVTPRPRRNAELIAEARRDSARIAEETEVERMVTGRPAPASPVVDTARAVRLDSLAGSLHLTGRVEGSIKRMDGEARAEAKGLLARGSSVGNAIADVTVRDAFTPTPRLETKARMDSLSVSGFLLDSAALTVSFQQDSGNVVAEVVQSRDARYALAADYSITPEDNALRLARTALQFDTTQWNSQGPATIRWGKSGVLVEGLDLNDGRGGRLYANGRVAPDGAPAANLDVDIRNFELAHLSTLLQTDLFFGGLFSLQAKVGGTLGAPLFDGRTSVTRATYGATGLPPVRGRFGYDGDEFDATVVATNADTAGVPIAVVTARVPLNLGGEGELLPPESPWRIDVDADSLPLDMLGQLTDAVKDVRGHAEGEIQVRGTAKRPKLSGDMNILDARMELAANGMKLRDLVGTVRLRNDTVRIDSIAARSAGKPVRFSGTVGIADIEKPTFNLALQSNGARVLDNDMGVLDADANVTLTGSLKAPVVSGRVRVRDGVIYVPQSDGRTLLSSDDPSLFAVADTSVAEVRELVGISPFLQNLRMKIDIAVDRDVWVRSREANVEIYGDLDLTMDRGRQQLVLLGDLNTDRGEYAVFGRRFQLRQGTITFIGDPDINPLLQLTGQVDVRQASGEALPIRVVIGGTLEEPRITLESDAQPPIEQTELLSLLAFGQTTTSLLQQGGSSVGGGASGSNSGVGAVGAFAGQRVTSIALGAVVDAAEGDAARSLGIDVLNIQPADVYTELLSRPLSGVLGNVGSVLQATEFEVGKYVDPSTFISLRARPTTQATPGLRIERRAGAGWRYEGTFESRYMLQQPTLELLQETRTRNALGLFIVREWRF